MKTLEDIKVQLNEKELEELQTITKRVKNSCKTKMIILYGSYARGEQVRYKDGKMSDYDILVITHDNRSDDVKRSKNTLNELFHDIGRKVSCEVFSMKMINNKLREDYYYFSDVRKDAVYLYSASNAELPEPIKLTPEKEFEISEHYFKTWFKQIKVSFEDFQHNYDKRDDDQVYLNRCAFHLQQCLENCYKTIELVHMRYAPKEHHLPELRKRIQQFAPAIYRIFSIETEELKKGFDHLNKAYIEARYDDSYSVTEKQLDYWQKEAKKLINYVENVCKIQLKVLKANLKKEKEE